MQKTTRPVTALQGCMIATALSLGLCAAGCHSSPPPAPPVPTGYTPVDSTKPPPAMANTYQQSQAAKSGAAPATPPR